MPALSPPISQPPGLDTSAFLALMLVSTLPTPAQMLRLSLRGSAMMAEAQAVVAMRMLGLMGFWPVAPDENALMVVEKLAALHEAQAAMMRAALKGGSAATLAEAGLRPLRRRTRANAERLSRRCPALVGG
ncbi:antibiotic ABC transporter [Pseudogemmobacter sonorensis]|uniref:antibiotic ABC transporter n=1 Tax=Pseudogemmobacter sonorensis TaxID=2989681 RepID=UPI0036ACE5C1